jgi:hypothetical protein
MGLANGVASDNDFAPMSFRPAKLRCRSLGTSRAHASSMIVREASNVRHGDDTRPPAIGGRLGDCSFDVFVQHLSGGGTGWI